ncbi:LpxI family protein [Haematobacter genomosp. 1]|uniref:Phosphatidate cytidylyltransferase n=1 Tax=Haematobacter genomosp. 1 TaxID=366618 RepID=A0A212AD05_9RHOB|nr:UDP-2,3-diacylglucosamine diphosphatase LpxI [Haematobacter genomosp. 1]OWJ78864.1 phosphatidate cytidylyltransferase [Haematobacter genomosp. 1]
MSRVAIIAGTGRLPALLADTLETREAGFVLAGLPGVSVEGRVVEPFRFERLVPFMDRLHELDVDRLIFAGGLRRPKLEPDQFDSRTMQLIPRVAAAMQGGDDAILREVLAIFEEDGFRVVGADEIAPELVPEAGILTAAQPSPADERDVARAAEIVRAIGAADVGQGAVVAQGLCLAAESLPGTDAMLDWVAGMQGLRPDPGGARGVLYKAPKPGQERRMDLPAIGPRTVERAVAAGLAGVAFEAGGVLLIDREEMVSIADTAGLFLWARQP